MTAHTSAARWSTGLLPAMAGALLLAGSAGAQEEAGSITVPRAAAPELDARISPGEWDGAARVLLSDGSELRLQHDGRYLFMALRASAPGIPSVCVVKGDVVHVLHASAGLGQAVYHRTGSQWEIRTGFKFGVRTREDTPAARAERGAFLQESGWLGTTMYLGDRVQKEMQIQLSLLDSGDPRIALAFLRDSPAVRASSPRWPAKLEDGCADVRLVRGFDVRQPSFDPSQWMRLTIAR